MRSLLLLAIICLLGCSKGTPPDMGVCTEYFPSEVSQGPGAVWKYYVHMTPNGGQRKTNIKFRKVVFKNSKLYLKDYAADYKESYNEIFSIADDVWKMDSTYTYDYRRSLDSLRTAMVYEITDKNTFLNWKGNEAKLKRSISSDNWKNDLSESHSVVKDTVVNGNKVKTFYGVLESNFKSKTDTTNTIFKWRREFTSARGMTNQYVETEKMTYDWQLDEIMSVEEFEKRASHGTHRVAYIDPEHALDKNNDFETCYHISKINDYYNDDRAEHLGGKGGLWEMLENNLDATIPKEQDGYLTYRFVVNCKGEAGRFVTEEADLKYDRIEFSESIRNHLLKILMEVPKWKNLSINGEPRDAYVYVTFKIKDNEIIEILP